MENRNRPGLICCHCENPITDERRICCNEDGEGCRFFDEECRDCFWPDFTHPRWLPCRILYGCCDGCNERRERRD